ncbi:MAG: SpoIID/LytB domain-containing protein [bacterium]|nr:SpoIID/LytB domain-containing protein [bacterium]
MCCVFIDYLHFWKACLWWFKSDVYWADIKYFDRSVCIHRPSQTQTAEALTVRIAVLREQTEVTLIVVEGSYLLSQKHSERRIQAGEKLTFAGTDFHRKAWLKRTNIQQPTTNSDLRTGITATFRNPDGEMETIHSHRYFQLTASEPLFSPDPLFTHAQSIAQSEKIGNTIVIPDERRAESPEITLGWTVLEAPITLYPIHDNSKIAVSNVRIGIGFHWDHLQTLTYTGILHIEKLNRGLCVVVEIPLEEYLASVNSSEMPADLPLEFMKAQTVAARSWLLANLGTHHTGAPFDICSDDHCQCFHGSQKLQEKSILAVECTRSEILVCNDQMNGYTLTDARYAKTCGGRFEPGEAIWGGPTHGLVYGSEQLEQEPIRSEKDAFDVLKDKNQNDFCNPRINIYPNSLRYAEPYYRWEFHWDERQLCAFIQRSLGISWDGLDAVEIVQRGLSGRIHSIRLGFQKKWIDVSGELAIRRLFSDTHLPSSAFVIERSGTTFSLYGAGWGHGAGLCQTGAAVRATLGQNYQEILKAYYPTSILVKAEQLNR